VPSPFFRPNVTATSSPPEAGTYVSNGTAYSNVGFYVTPVVGAAGENAGLADDYYPYDRIVHCPTLGRDLTNGAGAFLFQQNEIRQQQTTPSNAWPVVHTVSGMSNVLNFAVHTGLYLFFGTDGRAYLGGFYKGTNAGEAGAVVFDVAAGTWSSFVLDVGTNFTACTYPAAHRGRLWLAVEDAVLVLDPARMNLQSRPLPSDAFADPRHKFVTLGSRLLLVGRDSAGQMAVWEALPSWVKQTQLASFTSIAAGGDFAAFEATDQVYVIWRQSATEIRVYRLQATSRVPYSALAVTPIVNGPILLNLDPKTVCWVLADSDASPANATQFRLFTTIYAGVAPTPAAFTLQADAYGFFPATGGVALQNTGAVGAGVSRSSGFGLGPGILNGTNKVVPIRVEKADAVKAGALRITYWAFNTSALAQALRVYYRRRDAGTINGEGGKLPLTAGTLLDFTGPTGSLNVAGKYIDGVSAANAGVESSVVWDRVADLGSSFESDVYLDLLMADAGLLPPV